MTQPLSATFVRFLIPGPNGPHPVMGRIVRSLPAGRLEVKTADHGYFTITLAERIPMKRESDHV